MPYIGKISLYPSFPKRGIPPFGKGRLGGICKSKKVGLTPLSSSPDPVRNDSSEVSNPKNPLADAAGRREGGKNFIAAPL